MFFTPVNFSAVGVAAIASMVIGFLWYSPLLFAKPWMKYSKLDEKKLKPAQKEMPKTYGISFIASLITASVLFQNMPWGLFLINSGYQLASLLAMSAILTLWI